MPRIPQDLYFVHPRWPVFLEDNHLLVLYKPAGLLAQGNHSNSANLLDLAKDWLKVRHGKSGRVFLGLVHRLDRPVAGVMVFARTSKAAARLSEQFRNGTARKVYLAVLEGKPKPDSAELIDYIVRRGNTALILPEPAAGSREARLCYRVLDSTGSRSLVEVTLETGRKHQIRLQLARRGHPVAGDMRYGASAPFRARQIALLASELSISHPTRRTLQRFRCPPPVGWPWPQVSRETAAPLWNWTDYGIR